jgi:hypothetical protein
MKSLLLAGVLLLVPASVLAQSNRYSVSLGFLIPSGAVRRADSRTHTLLSFSAQMREGIAIFGDYSSSDPLPARYNDRYPYYRPYHVLYGGGVMLRKNLSLTNGTGVQVGAGVGLYGFSHLLPAGYDSSLFEDYPLSTNALGATVKITVGVRFARNVLAEAALFRPLQPAINPGGLSALSFSIGTWF